MVGRQMMNAGLKCGCAQVFKPLLPITHSLCTVKIRHVNKLTSESFSPHSFRSSEMSPRVHNTQTESVTEFRIRVHQFYQSVCKLWKQMNLGCSGRGAATDLQEVMSSLRLLLGTSQQLKDEPLQAELFRMVIDISEPAPLQLMLQAGADPFKEWFRVGFNTQLEFHPSAYSRLLGRVRSANMFLPDADGSVAMVRHILTSHIAEIYPPRHLWQCFMLQFGLWSRGFMKVVELLCRCGYKVHPCLQAEQCLCLSESPSSAHRHLVETPHANCHEEIAGIVGCLQEADVGAVRIFMSICSSTLIQKFGNKIIFVDNQKPGGNLCYPRHQHSDKDGSRIPEVFKHWVRNELETPCSLQRLCRGALLGSVNGRLMETLPLLGLPSSLESFLMYKEVLVD